MWYNYNQSITSDSRRLELIPHGKHQKARQDWGTGAWILPYSGRQNRLGIGTHKSPPLQILPARLDTCEAAINSYAAYLTYLTPKTFMNPTEASSTITGRSPYQRISSLFLRREAN